MGKCKSKTVPCKAGERCPDHKFWGSYPLTSFGVAVLEKYETILKARLNVPKAELVKLVRLDSRTDIQDSLKTALTKRFGELSGKFEVHKGLDAYVVNKTSGEYAEDEKSSTILCSLVAHTNTSRYAYASKSLDIPVETYFVAGFEPNPYFWAGKQSPWGFVYPPEEEIAKLNKAWCVLHETPANSPATPLNQMRRLQKYPFVRGKGGFRFLDYVTTEGKNFPELVARETRRCSEAQASAKLNRWYGPGSLVL